MGAKAVSEHPILTTDAHGRAQTTLTLGQTAGLNKVSVTADDLPEITFTATAFASSDQTAVAAEGDSVGNVQNADVNDDGVVDVEDLDAVVAHLGQADENDTDVNEDGNVDTADIVLVAEALGSGTSAPSLPYTICSKVHRRGSPTVAHSSSTTGYDSSCLSARGLGTGAAPLLLDSQKDSIIGKLSESAYTQRHGYRISWRSLRR